MSVAPGEAVKGRGAAHESLRARLHLHAVLPGLQDVVAEDAEMAALVAGTRLTVQFRVAGGPAAAVCFADGRCTVRPLDDRAAVGESSSLSPGHEGGGTVTLFFTSAAQLNRMFDGRGGTPIPLRGFGKLGFMQREFTKLTERLSYYLKPTPELFADPDYLAMNTRLMLTTAAFAVPILLEYDPVAAGFRRIFDGGSIALTVLPDGPSVGLVLSPQRIVAVKGGIDAPTALIRMRDVHIASAFLNGTLDTFAAVACGDVEISGQLRKVDALGLVLERVPVYLS
ncbi:MAG: hypothetical protein FJ000_03145 [Actinobacteria bacterium]|nr:hypothetical protein [Actinomycetota bacterium]